MSEIWKGTVGPVLVAEEPQYDASTGDGSVIVTYQGSRNAIYGMTPGFASQGVSYQISQSGPVYTLSARIPVSTGMTEVPPDRYEISTESQDKDIFENPTVIADAEAYDAALATNAKTYRKRAEDAVSEYDIGPTATFQSVVRHLKGGVTGYQIDFITLRRFRKCSLEYGYGSAGKIYLDSGLYIYTTAQLNLPQDVAFSLPATPSDPSTDYSWGWRKRGQRVDIVGNYAEQTVELVFAPWSTLLYEDATGNLDW